MAWHGLPLPVRARYGHRNTGGFETRPYISARLTDALDRTVAGSRHTLPMPWTAP